MTTETNGISVQSKPSVALISSSCLPMPKTNHTVKTYRRIWDADKALRCTHKGHFDKYQLRAYLFIILGYAVIVAWLTAMPIFALLPPKDLDCRPINQTTDGSIYHYDDEYGRTVLTDFKQLCNETTRKIPHIILIIGLILGSLIFGAVADHNGRKMVLLGSTWTACILSIFQLLSSDYISYTFFMIFLGITIGAVLVVALPLVMEMFPVESRAIYGLLLLFSVFLLDLVIPWLAVAIKNWKILQAVITIPLIFTAPLYWFCEESTFWYTAQKDYVTAVLSLIEIGKFNGVHFQEIFRDAKNFLHGKHSKAIQCDFQPALPLESLKLLGDKYSNFDAADFHAANKKPDSFVHRLREVIAGHHYQPTLSTFYPTDFLHSPILAIYLIITCGLWLVNSLIEFSLDSPDLTQDLTKNFLHDYFYTELTQIVAFLIALPLIYFWGRRWPIFCFFLLAEICLLGSIAVKSNDDQTRPAMLTVYFIGKFAASGAFLVIFILTCEIFPTGLRCTGIGICYTFRFIGILLASPNVGGLNEWMARLIYGILSLILGSLALLLPETKKMPLPRTMIQIESIQTSISRIFRRRRFVQSRLKEQNETTSINPTSPTATQRLTSHVSYDPQLTVNSFYVFDDYRADDTVHSLPTRCAGRRNEPRNTILSPTFVRFMNDNERQKNVIQEDIENEDEPERTKSMKITDDIVMIPVQTNRATDDQFSAAEISSQPESSVRIPLEKNINDEEKITLANPDDVLSRSPRFQRTMSQDENYFSEHC